MDRLGPRPPPPGTEPQLTIAGFNTNLLPIAATLCGLFAVLALSVIHLRHEARRAILWGLRLSGFAFGYLVIGLVYIPIRILDFASRAWPSSPDDGDDDDGYYYYRYDEDNNNGSSSRSRSSSNRRRKKKSWLDRCDRARGDEFPRTRQIPRAASTTTTGHPTRANSDVSDLELEDMKDLEKGISTTWLHKTKTH